MSVKDADSKFASTDSPRPGRSHATTDQGVAMSSCRPLPVSSPTPFPSSAISPPPLSAAHRPDAQSPPRGLASRPSVSFATIPKKSSFNTRDLATTGSRSPSHSSTAMGQGRSKSSQPLPNPPSSSSASVSKGFQAALAGGIKLKRALANRRKKSEDVSQLFGSRNNGTPQDSRQLSQEQQGRHVRVESCAPLTSSVSLPSGKGHKPMLNLNNPTVLLTADHLSPLSPTPPTPPPKSPPLQQQAVRGAASDQSHVRDQLSNTSSDNRSSTIPLSPGISGAVKLICMNEEQREKKEPSTSGIKLRANTEDRGVNAGKEQPKQKPREADTSKRESINVADIKEARRKSDSTMSYQTIRPGTTSNRTSRPVSMAESLQSNHTVKPYRISALLTDVDFTMLEEDDDTCKGAGQDAVTMSTTSTTIVHSPEKASQEVSRKTKSRRSLSLNLGSYTAAWKVPPTPPASHHPALSLAEIKYPSYSVTEGMPPPVLPPVPTPAKEASTVAETETFATSQPGHAPSSHGQVGHNLRGKLPSWTNISPVERKSPGSHLQIPSPIAGPSTSSYPPQALRAISMTNSLAPAAGRAIRGAVGRMGRAMGISSSSSNSGYNSGYSSSASARVDGYGLTRTNSNQSSSVSHAYSPLSWAKRRTPDAPSGAWSVASSTSEVDHMGLTPPVLGVMLRAPHSKAKPVFGRELKVAVAETIVHGEGSRALGLIHETMLRNLGKELEERALPAVVLRCAQHVLVRGIQEEGLFRVNGRAKHVATIRTEFDKGADYDMAACEPVDLDPHAVASVFKAYFRELPEPVLTAALLPYFEKIVEQEAKVDVGVKASHALKPVSRGPGLPSGPRPGNVAPNGMKKPPSLSTLALPSFKDIPPPSNSLLRALAALTAQLPEENRDLLRTLVDIMNVTAKHEKATKMPLANLLLVFCPTVQMTPPLLRILCEARTLWNHEDALFPEETLVIDRADSSSSGAYTDALDGSKEQASLFGSEGTSEDHPASMSDYHASTEDSIIDPRPAVPRNRPTRLVREPQSTVYLDADGGSSSSASSLPQPRSIAGESKDNLSLASSQCANAPSPSMTSSAESLVTPASSSGQPSLAHLPIEEKRKSEVEPETVVTPESPKYINEEPTPHTVEFPTLPPSAPTTSLPSTPVKRRSIPLLSLPHIVGINTSSSAIFGPPSPTASHSSSPLLRKSRKPSLQILLSAKGSKSSLQGISKASISSPIMNADSTSAPLSASDSSVSTPQSAMTAPRIFSSPPVIDTPLENSPLGLRMGLQITPPDTAAIEAGPYHRDDDDALTLESAKTGTPIADRYRTDSTASTSSSVFPEPFTVQSVPRVLKAHHSRLPPRRPSTASTPSTSSNHLGFLDGTFGAEEDWTRSVLIAADMESIWLQNRR